MFLACRYAHPSVDSGRRVAFDHRQHRLAGFRHQDRTRAQQAGFSQREVASNLLITLSGSQQSTPTFWLNPRNGGSYNVIIEAPQYTIDSLQSLANIPLTANGRSNGLGSLATMKREAGNATLTRYNAQTTIDIFGTADGRDLGGVSNDISKIIDDVKANLQKSSTIEVRGQVQTVYRHHDRQLDSRHQLRARAVARTRRRDAHGFFSVSLTLLCQLHA
nr:efflux RND transporter permease subunit [Burkholderia sp. WP9]